MTLDAYGHLNWTVGHEDWIACFDAIRAGDAIHYHVVVDCESGGFTDTLEDGRVKLDDANGIANLKSAPFYWADICAEHYRYVKGFAVDPAETQKTADAWATHLDALVAAGPCRDEHECGNCDECQTEGFDPVRDGWIGSDGRP